MNLTLSDEQRALQETAADFLAEQGNARKDVQDDAGLWAHILELGWAAVQVPEEFDGLGLGAVELGLLMEEMGRRLVRTPFFSTVVLAQTALLQAGSAHAQQRCLPALAFGAQAATLILGPGLDADPATLTVHARRDGEGWHLHGEAAQVLDDGQIDVAYVAARLEGDAAIGLFEVQAGATGVERTPLEVWDLADLGLGGADLTSGVQVIEAGESPARQAGTIITDAGEGGRRLAAWLVENKLV